MTNSLQINSSTVFAGLGTSTFTVVTTGLYTFAFTSTIPHVEAGGPGDSTTTTGGSGLQVVLNLNGSAQLTVGGTSTNPTPYQASLGGSVRLQCTAGDVLTAVLTSAKAVDAGLNAVKTTFNLYQGE